MNGAFMRLSHAPPTLPVLAVIGRAWRVTQDISQFINQFLCLVASRCQLYRSTSKIRLRCIQRNGRQGKRQK
jgi:hypothetical protein